MWTQKLPPKRQVLCIWTARCSRWSATDRVLFLTGADPQPDAWEWAMNTHEFPKSSQSVRFRPNGFSLPLSSCTPIQSKDKKTWSCCPTSLLRPCLSSTRRNTTTNSSRGRSTWLRCPTEPSQLPMTQTDVAVSLKRTLDFSQMESWPMKAQKWACGLRTTYLLPPFCSATDKQTQRWVGLRTRRVI